MVGACNCQRCHETFRTEFLNAFGSDVEIFQSPSHLLTGQHNITELGLSSAHRLNRHDSCHDSAVVVDRANTLRGNIALTCTVDDIQRFLNDLEV